MTVIEHLVLVGRGERTDAVEATVVVSMDAAPVNSSMHVCHRVLDVGVLTGFEATE